MGGIVSYIVGPGHIRHAGVDPFVTFGEADDSTSERTQDLLQAFLKANVRANIPTNFYAEMWGKCANLATPRGIGAQNAVAMTTGAT